MKENELQNLGKLLKVDEVVEILNISKSLGYQLIRQGDIPKVTVGNCIRIREIDLENYIMQNRAP